MNLEQAQEIEQLANLNGCGTGGIEFVGMSDYKLLDLHFIDYNGVKTVFDKHRGSYVQCKTFIESNKGEV